MKVISRRGRFPRVLTIDALKVDDASEVRTLSCVWTLNLYPGDIEVVRSSGDVDHAFRWRAEKSQGQQSQPGEYCLHWHYFLLEQVGICGVERQRGLRHLLHCLQKLEQSVVRGVGDKHGTVSSTIDWEREVHKPFRIVH